MVLVVGDEQAPGEVDARVIRVAELSRARAEPAYERLERASEPKRWIRWFWSSARNTSWSRAGSTPRPTGVSICPVRRPGFAEHERRAGGGAVGVELEALDPMVVLVGDVQPLADDRERRR